jgi:hypothetical protein
MHVTLKVRDLHAADPEDFEPGALDVAAYSEDGQLMGFSHDTFFDSVEAQLALAFVEKHGYEACIASEFMLPYECYQEENP